MGKFLGLTLGGMLFGFAWMAMAGDIKTRKGAHGVNVYQNAPCAGAAELAHSQYSDRIDGSGSLKLLMNESGP